MNNIPEHYQNKINELIKNLVDSGLTQNQAFNAIIETLKAFNIL